MTVDTINKHEDTMKFTQSEKQGELSRKKNKQCFRGQRDNNKIINRYITRILGGEVQGQKVEEL